MQQQREREKQVVTKAAARTGTQFGKTGLPTAANTAECIRAKLPTLISPTITPIQNGEGLFYWPITVLPCGETLTS